MLRSPSGVTVNAIPGLGTVRSFTNFSDIGSRRMAARRYGKKLKSVATILYLPAGRSHLNFPEESDVVVHRFRSTGASEPSETQSPSRSVIGATGLRKLCESAGDRTDYVNKLGRDTRVLAQTRASDRGKPIELNTVPLDYRLVLVRIRSYRSPTDPFE